MTNGHFYHKSASRWEIILDVNQALVKTVTLIIKYILIKGLTSEKYKVWSSLVTNWGSGSMPGGTHAEYMRPNVDWMISKILMMQDLYLRLEDSRYIE